MRLKNTKGIGDTTYKVIRQAQAGEVPDYLANLRETSSVAAKSELRAKLKGDLHAHSEWSDGTHPGRADGRRRAAARARVPGASPITRRG